MPEKDETITAQVVLYSPQGNSILNQNSLLSGNIQSLTPDNELVLRVTKELQKLGFQCTPLYPTLSISGPQWLFEKTFALTFEKKILGQTSFVQPKRKATLPDTLKNTVADIVFGEPMEPFI